MMRINIDNGHMGRLIITSLLMLTSLVVSANGIEEADYFQIILYGQSLSMGWECPIAISKTPISGNYMVGSSPLINHGNDGTKVLNPLVAVKSTVGGEQPIVGCVNAFSQLYRKFINREQKFIASSVGEGGQSIETLSKGCTNTTDKDVNNNYYHSEFLKLLDYTYEAVEKTNSVVVVPAILYMQGEYNYVGKGLGMTTGTEATKKKEEYKSYLLQLKNDMQTDIMQKYGQTYRPLFFIYEVCGTYINLKDMPINMAQIEFASENDDVFLLNPTYFTPDYGGGHLSTNGYRWYGEIMAKTMYHVMIDGEYSKSNITPIDITAKNNQIFIEFEVPVLPLVFDTWTKESIKSYGFRVLLDGTEITINSLSIDENVIILNCDTAIRGDLEIIYAGQGRNGSGNLRDSDDFQAYNIYYDDSESQIFKPENYTPKDKEGNKIYGQYYPLYNWCPNFYKRMEIEGEMTKYLLTYMVDGKDYKSYDVEYGAPITPEAEPTKEGYTFSGWSDIPETMPAHDVTVTGSFTINEYKLTYMLDGDMYKSYDIEYGAPITPETEPTREGYTFSGWSDIPETMPAHDVTVTGLFTINEYKLTYMLDGDMYKSYDVEYGAPITPEAEPTKEGYAFSGWSDIPETMPAHDVTVTGTFSQAEFYVDNVTYKITGEGTVTIVGSDQKGAVEIKATIDINGRTYIVTSIAENAFKDNQNIFSVIIADGISTIGDNAFNGCHGLRKISFGVDVNSIGRKAFANVGTKYTARKNVEENSIVVNCYAESVPKTVEDAFENTSIEAGTLYVVDNSIDAFKVTSPWNRFGTIVGLEDAAGIYSITTDSLNAHIYDMQGIRLYNPRKGLNIIRENKGKARKIVVR